MRHITCLALVLASVPAIAAPQPKAPPAALPKVGDPLPLAGNADWPKLAWLYDVPSTVDAAGKVVVHWFCAPKIKTCADDLARMINLRDTGHVYIVAYINGSGRDSKKLDPIRESEGVGKGTVAYGPGVAKLAKDFGLTEAAIVVDTDGKIKAITTSGDLNELDARDKAIGDLVANIHEYASSHDGPATAKPNEKFTLSIKIQLASWLGYTQSSPPEFTTTGPKELRCDKATKIDAHVLTASVTCAGPRGVYEMQGRIRFTYDVPGHPGAGTGEDGATWKFEIK
jgi:hypothetical protein